MLYRPRMAVKLYLPSGDSPAQRSANESNDELVPILAPCHRLRIESNPHNLADECEVALTYDAAGVDPRFIRNAVIYVYVGDGDDDGTFTPSLDTLRFLGIVVEASRAMGESGGMQVHLLCQDYTCLFLATKPFSPKGVPELTDNLRQAWGRICDFTGLVDFDDDGHVKVVSTVSQLRDRMEFRGVTDPGPIIGSAMPKRLGSDGKLPVAHEADAWAVWKTAVGAVGLITYIENDRVIVTTATDYYTGDDPPRFVWGKNVVEFVERRNVHSLNAKPVCLQSYDPLQMRMMQAFWPAVEKAAKKKRSRATALAKAAATNARDFDVFIYPYPVANVDVLTECARLVYEERSRAELTGNLKTIEMFVDTASDSAFDLLGLRSGHRIRVEIDREALTEIQKLASVGQRTGRLVALGYQADMAEFIAKNLDSITSTTPEFQVHSVVTEMETSAEGGSFSVSVSYVNRIAPSGSSTPGTGTSSPAVTGQKPDRPH